ncbi:MAG: aldehyde dehydrogenase family protein, partial [Nitrososphaerales archaeon]
MASKTVTAVSTINPSNEEVLAQYEIMGSVEVGGIVKQARNAFVDWNNIGIIKRAEFMHNFAQELRRNKTNLARTCTREMGKPIKES